jgi:hypothetical protein
MRILAILHGFFAAILVLPPTNIGKMPEYSLSEFAEQISIKGAILVP